MRSLLFLSLLLLVSACGARKSSPYEMGKATRADVEARQGPPTSVVDLQKINPSMVDSKIMNYDDNEKIQLKGDVVVNRFTNPKGDEKLVLWWKNKFKDCTTKEKKLPRDPKAHTPGEIELSCPAEGLSIIYTEGASSVSRVVEFEK